MATSIQPASIKGYHLSSFKSHPDMSEETLAFTAYLHHEGGKIGSIRNSGRGAASLVRCDDPQHPRLDPDSDSGYTVEFDARSIPASMDTALIALAEVAQAIATRRGSIGVIANPDIQEMISGEEIAIHRIKGKSDPASAAEYVMDRTGATSAAVAIDGVLHIATKS